MTYVSKGSKELKTDWPVEDSSVLNLIPVVSSKVYCRNRVGIR